MVLGNSGFFRASWLVVGFLTACLVPRIGVYSFFHSLIISVLPVFLSITGTLDE